VKFLLLGRPWDSYGSAIRLVRYVPLLAPHIGPRTLYVAPGLVRLFGALGVSVEPLAAGSISDADREIRARYPTLSEQPDGTVLLLGWGGRPYLVVQAGWSHDRWPWPLGREIPLPAPLCADDAIRLPAAKSKIGLCWTGGLCRLVRRAADPNPEVAAVRQVQALLDALPSLLALPDVAWYALHLADPLHRFADQSAALGLPGLADLGVRDWADTAGVVRQLDCVITVDSVMADLAGSLGVLTYLLLAAGAGAEVWGHDSTTPWYPSVRIFRQATAGDWAPVIDAVRERLPLLATAMEAR